MWLLTSLSNPDLRYALLVGKTYIAGRKDCEILVENDAAVSRRHAEMTIAHQDGNLNKLTILPTLTIKDLSKYGTMLNNSKVQGQTTVSDGDEIMFGSPKSSFIAVYEPMVVSTSCLSPALKKQVRQTVMQLGGHIVADWSRHCTHLVMTSISVTIKVVCAMVALKPIVSPDYLDAYLQSLEKRKEQPDPESFLPTVSESQVDPTEVSFTNDPRRKTIFQGKTFVFLQQKQFQKMSLAVELGGGIPLLMETRPDGRGEDAVLTQKDTVVMDCGHDGGTTSQWKEWYKYVEKMLARHKRHMSQDAELGLAVLHCDTEQYCNPCVDFASQMVSHLPSQSLSQAPVFTQTQRVKQEKKSPPSTQPKLSTSESIKGQGSQGTKVSNQGHKDTAKGQSGKATTSRSGGQSSEIDRSQNTRQKAKSPSPKKKPEKSNLSPVRRSPRSRSPSPAPYKSESLSLRSRSSVSPDPKRSNRRPSPAPESVTDSSVLKGPFAKRAGISSPRNTQNDNVIKKEKVLQIPKSRPGKRQIIEDDSDEDYDFTRKSKRKRDEDQNEDNPFDWSSRKNDVKKSKNSQRVSDKDENDDIVVMDSESETENDRGQMSVSRKGQEVRVLDSDSDSGTKWTGKGKGPAKGQKVKSSKGNVGLIEESQTVGKKKRKLDDSSDDEDINQRSKVKIKKEPGISSPQSSARGRHSRMEEQEDEQTDRQEIVTKQEKITPRKPTSERTRDQDRVQAEANGQRKRTEPASVSGFLSVEQGQAIQEEGKYHGNYVKEEGIPTDLVQTVFVDLVAQRPSRPQNTPARSDTDVPAGYSRWKDRVVKNFKKFKKAGVAGLDRLPNIIGGSDLVPHQTSQRRELDEWFKEAQQAESQQSEANRRAQELFEWEPRSHTNRSR
ncbi:nibrin-like [Argopecten irradians]|uniref:nibrin-like n=1 Tax=Argopecten irradians TaxID=31199 RepID=UPI00371D78AD